MSVPLAYLTVVAIWSTTPLAIQWSAVDAGYAFALALRMLIGLVVSGILLLVWRTEFPFNARARRSYLVGGLGMFGGMFCTYWGAQYVHSGLISVLFGLSPLITGVLAVRWLGEPALGARKLLGMALALVGLGIIFLAGHAASGQSAVLGIAMLLLGVTVYSVTLVALKRNADSSPPMATTFGTLAVAMPLFAASWWLAGSAMPLQVSVRGGASIVYLGIFGSVVGFALYYYVIKHMEASKVALITLVTPVLALLLGNLLNAEAVGARVWVGTLLIIAGLLVHQFQSLRQGFLKA